MAREELTQKQELFCNHYVECGGNASEAYRRAFDAKDMSDRVVWNEASKLLNSHKVAVKIKELQRGLRDKSDITKERVLEELGAIMEAKITDYVELTTREVAVGDEGDTKEVQTLAFKDFDRLSERQVRAIESVRQGRNGIELKLHGKSWTIERICKMLGYDAPERSEINLTADRIQASPLNDLSLDQLDAIANIIEPKP